MTLSVILAIVAAAVVILYGIAVYNGLVKARNWVKESWSQIDVQLKRRHDLIPNLVETVKAYAAHEKETLDRVIRARNMMMSGTPRERMEADNALTSALKSVFALAESYPELKANQNFLALQEELTSTENKVAYSRQLYNKTVADYNIRRESFPAIIFANLFGFKPEEQLTIREEEREAPRIKF